MRRILFIAFIGWIAASASAATLRVTHNPGAGEYSSVAAAIEDAVSGDIIEIVGDGTPYDEGIINPHADKVLSFIGTTDPRPIFQSKNLVKNDPIDPRLCILFFSAAQVVVENIHFIANNVVNDDTLPQGVQYPFDLRGGDAVFRNCKIEVPEHVAHTMISHDKTNLFEDCEIEMGEQMHVLWTKSLTFRNCKITTNEKSMNTAFVIIHGGHVILDNCYVDYRHNYAFAQVDGGLIELINGTIVKSYVPKGSVGGFNLQNYTTTAEGNIIPTSDTDFHGLRMDHSIFALYGLEEDYGFNAIFIQNDQNLVEQGRYAGVRITNSDVIGGVEGAAGHCAASAIFSNSHILSDDGSPSIQIDKSIFYNWGWVLGFFEAPIEEANTMVSITNSALFDDHYSNNSTPAVDPSSRFFSKSDYPLANTLVYLDGINDNFLLYPSSEAAKMSPVPGSMGVASETDLPAWPMEAVKIASGDPAPVIDGVINTAEWARATPVDLRVENLLAKDPYRPEYTHRGSVYADNGSPGTISNDADCSAMIYYMWDDEAFYLAVSIKDDVNEPVLNSETLKVNSGDCFQLCIDYDNIRANSVNDLTQQGYALIPSWAAVANKGSFPATEDGRVSAINPNFYQFWPGIFDQPNQLAGMSWEIKMSGANYDLEARIPWNAFKIYNESIEMPYVTSFPPKSGQVCGILPIVDDHDNGTITFMMTEYGTNGFPVEMPSGYGKMTFVLEGSAPSTNAARQWNLFK